MPISTFAYTYDKTGNRMAVVEADGSRVTWSDDDTYQLTAEHRTGTTPYRNTFAYDPAGNRTLKNEDGARTTYTYDVANQLTTSLDAAGTTTYVFDANGNQQLVRKPTGDRTTTTWDYENRTTLVQLPSAIRNTMAYDPDGLRVQLDESTGTTKFLWDDQNYLAETAATDVTQIVYTNEPARYGNLISQRRNNPTYWYHYDALGSTRQLTSSSEAVTDGYLYDAWGGLLLSTGLAKHSLLFGGIVGYWKDTDTDTYYIRARYYQPIIGLWLSVDPTPPLEAIHLYAYVSNRPTAWLDPSGMEYVSHQCNSRLGPGSCCLGVHCYDVLDPTGTIQLGVHCGITVYDCGNVTWIDAHPTKHPLDPSSCIKMSSGIVPGSRQGSTDTVPIQATPAQCDCVFNYGVKFATPCQSYDVGKCNSNWALRCLIAHCKLPLAVPGQATGGTDCKDCVLWSRPGPPYHGPPICLRWKKRKCP